MDRAIILSLPEGPVPEVRVPTAEQIFPDPELLLALDGDPPGSRVLAFRRLGTEISARRVAVREWVGPS